ncbi:MAG: hypothetical protein NTX53_06415 [candidate division WOR-3 bacterium]|nr:hypothetical protein [candidate division WOR-3 bacterium]
MLHMTRLAPLASRFLPLASRLSLLVLLAAGCGLFKQRPVWHYDTPGQAMDICIHNSVAYIADGDSGLLALSLDGRTTPTRLWRLDLGKAIAVAATDSVVYVGRDHGGFTVVDLSTRYCMSFSDPGTDGGVVAFVVESLRLYVGGKEGLSVYDISDRWHMNLIQSIDLPNNCADICRPDWRVFCAMPGYGVLRIYYYYPGDSVNVGINRLGEDAFGVSATAGGICLIGQGQYGIAEWGTPNMSEEYFVRNIDTRGHAYKAVWDDIAYVYVCDSLGLDVLHFDWEPGTVKETHYYTLDGNTRRAALAYGYVYTASGDAGVWIVKQE